MTASLAARLAPLTPLPASQARTRSGRHGYQCIHTTTGCYPTANEPYMGAKRLEVPHAGHTTTHSKTINDPPTQPASMGVSTATVTSSATHCQVGVLRDTFFLSTRHVLRTHPQPASNVPRSIHMHQLLCLAVTPAEALPVGAAACSLEGLTCRCCGRTTCTGPAAQAAAEQACPDSDALTAACSRGGPL